MLAALRTRDGRDLDIAVTTNGSALAAKAQALKDAGLTRVTVPLDSLDDATFRAVNDADFPVADVLHGIEVAHEVGLGPIKVNMVTKRGHNDQDIVSMAGHVTCLFAAGGHDLRALMRDGCSDEELCTVIADFWRERTDLYSDLRSSKTIELRATGEKKIEMSYGVHRRAELSAFADHQ